MVSSLILELSVIVVICAVLSYLFSKFKQPIIVGYIIAGFILGPAVFNLVKSYDTVLALSEIGIAFLLYAIGAELDLKKIKGIKRSIFTVTLIEVFATFGIGLFATKFILGYSWWVSVFVGAIVSLSSTAVVMKYMSDRQLINTIASRLLLGILLIQDLLIMLFLPLLIDSQYFTWTTIPLIVGKIALLVGIAMLINFVFRDILKESFKRRDLLFVLSLASCFAFIGLAYMLDFSIIIGAFIGGLILANYPYNLEILDTVGDLKSFFSMLFFVSLGMQITNLSIISGWFFLVLFVLAFVIKPLLLYIGTIYSGYDEKLSFYVSSGLFQISEFSLVLVQFAVIAGFFSEAQSTTLILFIALSMALTPYVLSQNSFFDKLLLPINKKIFGFIRKFVKSPIDYTELEDKSFKNHIVIFGLGRMGSGVLEGILTKKLFPKEKIVAIDDDPDTVINAINQGVFAICGQADNPEILDKISLNVARAVIITIPYYDVNTTILQYIDAKKIPVFIRAYYVNEAEDFYKRGIKYVVIPQVMATNELLNQVGQELNNEKKSETLDKLYFDVFKKYSKTESLLKRHHRYTVE